MRLIGTYLRIPRRNSVFLLVLAAHVAGPAWSHHSAAAVFDMTERIHLTGTLTGINWTNPHISISVDITNEQGDVETWSFEGPAPRLFRDLNDVLGEKSDFENAIGESVTVETSPARDGSFTGLLRHLALPDDLELSLCNDEAC